VNRSTFLAASGSAMLAGALPGLALAADSDVTLATPTGTLYGTLSLPTGRGPFPVALIIAGSGPTDRNGNNPLIPGKSDTYRLLAEALASRGIASLRYDKRGIAKSAAAAPPESDLRFEMYVNDAAAWQRQLRDDKRFSKIIIAGHSEGSLIGMLSAQHAPADAFVSLEGAGRRGSTVLLEQLKKQLYPSVFAQVQSVVNALQSGHTVTLPSSWPAPLKGLFSPTIQPYLISWFKYDPAVEIAKLRIPVTIVQGSADVQVTMQDAQALKAAAPKAKFVVVPGMNHALRYYPNTTSMQMVLNGYEDPTLPIEPSVVQALANALS
jgi:alpha-beta hydrolase superfamily lysophospholipase